MTVKDLKKNIRKALENKNLREALGRFGDHYVHARAGVYEHKDFVQLQKEIAEIKSRAAEKMDELAEMFEEKCRRLGVFTYRAPTAADARDYILVLAQQKGVRRIVKSKSMASEEIHLNEHLAGAGMEVVETDLGEWIIQLSGQKPSHMVMPAIHLTRYQVADILAGETGAEVEPDISHMVKLAREKLRPKFLEAEMGITGANVAVAETGTVVMCTNEGNGRLVSTLPPIHVVIVGMEKIIERFADMGPILEGLPRSATAQAITSYITMLTGPVGTPGPDGEPVLKEMHIVILDNGRTRMQRDPLFREALQCIRCASCLNVCPVYQLIGGHVFGHVYTGIIGTVLTAFTGGEEQSYILQELCLGCERCREVCPGNINLPKLNNALRLRAVTRQGLPVPQHLVIKKILPNRRLFHGIMRMASLAQKPLVGREGTVRHLPFFLAGAAKGRRLPAIAEVPLRSRVTGGTPACPAGKAGSRVGIFAGCLVDFVYPEIGESMQKAVEALGYKAVFPAGQTCCGYPARQLGVPDVVRDVALQNLAAFAGADVDYIVTPCPTCTYALKHMYPTFFNSGEEKEMAEGIAARVRDCSEFLFNQASRNGLNVKSSLSMKATYHDSCHLKRSLHISREPRELLTLAGVNLVEMSGADNCCGFGGSYSFKYPELAGHILEKKINSIRETGADTVVTGCPGCLMQIRGGLAARGEDKIKVSHIAQLAAGDV